MNDKPSETLRRIAHGLEIRKGTAEAGIPLPHADLMISQLRQIADRLESDPDVVDTERIRRLRETEDALVRARAMIDRLTLGVPTEDVFGRLASATSAAEHARSYALTARHELARRDPEAWRLVARELIDADLDVVRAGLGRERPSTITPADVEECLERGQRGVEDMRPALDAVFRTAPPDIRLRSSSRNVPATLRHDAGAIARCNKCGRYSMDPATLGPAEKQPACDCGEYHYWSGSFEVPGEDARWAGGNR